MGEELKKLQEWKPEEAPKEKSPYYPYLEKEKWHVQGPCKVTCPTCGYTRRRWTYPGKIEFIPPDRKPQKVVVVYCEKCGTIIVLNGLFGSPVVTPETVSYTHLTLPKRIV